MISAVSGVSFKGTTATAAANDFQTLVQSEGKFSTKNNAAEQPAADTVDISGEKPAKKGKWGKIIGGTIAGAAIIALALFGLKRGDVIKIDKEATGLGKVTSKLAEFGEWVGKNAIDPIVNLFKKKGAEGLADAAKDAANAAGGEATGIFA